jgi:hypothetical protein
LLDSRDLEKVAWISRCRVLVPLFWPTHLVRSLGDGDGRADLGCTTTVNDPVVSHKIPYDTDRIMQRAFSLVNDLNAME